MASKSDAGVDAVAEFPEGVGLLTGHVVVQAREQLGHAAAASEVDVGAEFFVGLHLGAEGVEHSVDFLFHCSLVVRVVYLLH